MIQKVFLKIIARIDHTDRSEKWNWIDYQQEKRKLQKQVSK